jgi:hypothetical protein
LPPCSSRDGFGTHVNGPRIDVLGFAGGVFATVATNLALVEEASVIGVVYGGHLNGNQRKPRR